MLLFNFITVERPEWFLLVIPLVLLLIILLAINFVHFSTEDRRAKRGMKVFLFFTRTLILLLACAALTRPFFTETTISDGDPTIMMLVDNSTSMALFDLDVEALRTSLEQKVPVTVDYIGAGTNSKLGDHIFRYLHKDSLLLVTDGNNDPESLTFKDLAGLSTKFNTSLNAIKLEEEHHDVSVSLQGPTSTIVDSDYFYTVRLDNIRSEVTVSIYIDDRLVHEEVTDNVNLKLSYPFSSVGYHKIRAEIGPEDYFSQNNVFYKVVEVVEKPKIFLFSNRESILNDLLSSRYAVTTGPQLPATNQELFEYFAVVVHDSMHQITYEQSKMFEEYTDDGNGLVVWGGENSFQGPSTIDLLLPVKLGTPEEKTSVFNFVIVVDASGEITQQLTNEEQIAYRLIDVLAKRKETIHIAALDFAHQAHLYHNLTDIHNEALVKAAMLNYQDVTSIDGVAWVRPANLNSGLVAAGELLDGVEGNNNVIVISDGAIRDEILQKSYNELRMLRDKNIRVHSYAAVNNRMDETILSQVRKQISSMGRGIYLTVPDDLNLMFEKKLVISDYNHFITHNLEINGVVTGYHRVVPAPSARTLITTGTGVPIITTNNYNKVATVTTDTGEEWAGDLFRDQNIVAVYRMIDWAVGDPNRKKTEYVFAPDTTLNKETHIEYKGPTPPETDKCTFLERDDYYECTYVPSEIGFDEVLGRPFAVNYALEYLDIGYNEEELEYLTQETSGLLFSEGKIDEIVEKAKQDVQMEVVKRHDLDTWLLGAALLIFLFEIFVRRVKRSTTASKGGSSMPETK